MRHLAPLIRCPVVLASVRTGDNQDQMLASDSLQHHSQHRPVESQKKIQKQDLLALGLGGVGMVTHIDQRGPLPGGTHTAKKYPGCFVTVTGRSWSTCCVSGPMGHHGDQADWCLSPGSRVLHEGSTRPVWNPIKRMESAKCWEAEVQGTVRVCARRPPGRRLGAEACRPHSGELWEEMEEEHTRRGCGVCKGPGVARV